MDQIVGIVIFIVIMGLFGLAKKIQDAQQRNPPPDIDPEDLPESTRRTLYGSTTVPKARPAQPRQIDELDEGEFETEETMAPMAAEPVQRAPRPVAQRLPAQRVGQPPRQRQRAPAQRRPAAPVRPIEVPRHVEAPPVPPPQREVVRRPAPQRRQAHPQRPARQPQQARERVAAGQPRPRVRRQAPSAKPAPLTGALFRDLAEVRRGIIAREILGPPKGLQ